ncbi:MAG: aldehyde dehydrogenase family protein [Actinobacteria bacterium]|nr:aldehyde dehydrogenase family protein [Actinomycetota bacterium]
MQMYVGGEWVSGDGEHEIFNPWSGDVLDTVPIATAGQVEQALGAALEGAHQMAGLTAWERSQILNRAAESLESRLDEFALTISLEQGKPLTEARAEMSRMPDLLRLSAFEGAQLRGEVLPLDAAASGADKLGLAMRVPCGVVVAITPFNFPILLVLHKVAPALAAGNAVILKPAASTPLVALKLVELLVSAGLPSMALQCLTGDGATLGRQLCSDPRVRKVTFTGSTAVGDAITKVAGVKRLSLELGGNAPVVVLGDGDIDAAAEQTAVGGYFNAGQVCISTQRVIVDRRVYGDFLDSLAPRVEAIRQGDPLEDDTRLAAMISEDAAAQVGNSIDEAISAGARLVAGGERDGAMHAATVVADVAPEMRIFREELFGPAVAVTPVDDAEEAMALANASAYGLSAGVFTKDLDTALQHARDLEAGLVYINIAPPWRADLMPYGGLKQSGIGVEGPRYAVQEMTEVKTVVIGRR